MVAGSWVPPGRDSDVADPPAGVLSRLERSHDSAIMATGGQVAMALKKLGHVVLKVRDLDRSEAFRNPFAGREPLPFQAARR